MNLREDYDGKTTLPKWWPIVKENFQKIVTAFDTEVKAREDAVSAEATARKNADDGLATRLSAVEQISGDTGGGCSLNNYEYEYDSEDESVIYINTVYDLPYGVYTFIPEKEITSLHTITANGSQSWDCVGNVFTPGNQYILQTNSDSINLDVIGVIPLEQNLINVKLSEIQNSSVSVWFNTEVFAEVGKVLVIQNDLENDVNALPIKDELWYTLSQPLEVGKIYVTITKSLPEEDGIDSRVNGAIDVYAWNGPESSGGTEIVVDSELSDTSENPVQNKVVKSVLDKKAEHKTLSEVDFNDVVEPGIYVMHTATGNTPDGAPVLSGCYTLIVGNSTSNSTNFVHQIAIPEITTDIYVRFKNGSSGWSEWEQLPKNLQYAHTTTPTQIGTWIDGTPIWRVSFDVDYAFEAESDGTYWFSVYSFLQTNGLISNPNYVTVLDQHIFTRAGTPCVIDDAQAGQMECGNVQWSSVNPSADGVYGYVDFITPKDNLATT